MPIIEESRFGNVRWAVTLIAVLLVGFALYLGFRAARQERGKTFALPAGTPAMIGIVERSESDFLLVRKITTEPGAAPFRGLAAQDELVKVFWDENTEVFRSVPVKNPESLQQTGHGVPIAVRDIGNGSVVFIHTPKQSIEEALANPASAPPPRRLEEIATDRIDRIKASTIVVTSS